MKFPSTSDFLEAFGLEPIEEDSSMAYCRYVKESDDGSQEFDFSFSGVAESFQLILRCNGNELITISSENVRLVEIRSDKADACIHVVFDVNHGTSEATLTMEPRLHCHWWTLRGSAEL